MIFKETKLKGAYIIEIKKFSDERGFFGRAWCKNEMAEYGLNINIVQMNVLFNKTKGTLRGMHYQKSPHEENKLIRCTKGTIYDVIIDLRKDSPTYKQWMGIELSENNYKMLYVPKKFAHGLITLKKNTEVNFLVTEFYTPSAQGGIRYDDDEFNIDWPVPMSVISTKDNNYPDFDESMLP